ncbi:MAG: peptidoglycan DD-metalloendopeptidase family protein, partial [Anaerolineaceae bacterium]
MSLKPFTFRIAFSIILITAVIGINLSSSWIAGPHPININNGSFTYPTPTPQHPDIFTFQEYVSHSAVCSENVLGSGGRFLDLKVSPTEDKNQWPPSGRAERAFWVNVAKNFNLASLNTSVNPSAILPTAILQLDLPDPLLADGQFVWGPNVGDFDIRSYLGSMGSPLEPYSDDIEIWARYTTVNPKVLLTVLELQYGYLNTVSDDLTPEMILETIENTSMSLAVAFYEHLHTWGTRKSTDDQIDTNQSPVVVFADGTAAQLNPDHSSGTFAIATTLAESTDMTTWLNLISTQDLGGFTHVFGTLFPETDRLDNSNNIHPPNLPTSDLFQFPFPLGATWHFNGPHSWAGDDTPPFSSMDFYTGGGTCDAPPNLYTVAAASGTAIRPYGYDCWLEIDHTGGWTTSYYHLQNLIDPQGATVNQNASLGTIACEVCAGGWATGPHVHWTLKFGGAYVSLEGVQVSGWTIHVGSEPYDTGYIEREWQTLDPFSAVLNDYHLYYPHENNSLRFYGNGENDIDRVKIPINDPPRPVDFGSTDFTLEWWMKANPGENNATNCTPGGQNWESGNHIFDRSVYTEDGSGELGVSLADGRITFGINNGTESDTLCGVTDIADGNWHHVAITRGLDGSMRIFIDGTLDAETVGPLGNISYPDGRTETHPNDPFLVVGSEKFDIDPLLYPPFSGWIDEIHISDLLRYDFDFTPSTEPTSPDGNSVGLYHFDEGLGNFINDTSGAWGGPTNGARFFGGDPAGPEWSTETPIIRTMTLAVSADFDGDGDTDIGVFKIESGIGIWHIYDHTPVLWGGSGSIPVTGDYDGDGDSDIAVFYAEAWGGTWYIKDQITASWGGSTSIPVPADYDGNGNTDIAVYHVEPWGGTWYIKDQLTVSWGGSGSIPVPADYDGDGDADIAVYHVEPWGGTWYIKDQPTVSWGGSGSIPVPADYDGDG